MQTDSDQPKWWDREFDEQGRRIRSDVRKAAHEVWEKACRRTIAVLGDETDAAELMECTVVRVSEFLDRRANSVVPDNLAGLLIVSFCRELNHLAARLRRVETVGSALDLEKNVAQLRWCDAIGHELDKSKVLALLSIGNRHIWFLRDQGYEWFEIAERMGTTPASAKSCYWRGLRKAFRALQHRSSAQSRSQNHRSGR